MRLNQSRSFFNLMPSKIFFLYLLIIFLGSLFIIPFQIDIESGLSIYVSYPRYLEIFGLLAIGALFYFFGYKVKLVKTSFLASFFYFKRSSAYSRIFTFISIIVFLSSPVTYLILLRLINEYGSTYVRSFPQLLGIGPLTYLFTTLYPISSLQLCNALQVFPYRTKNTLIGISILAFGITPVLLLDIRSALLIYSLSILIIVDNSAPSNVDKKNNIKFLFLSFSVLFFLLAYLSLARSFSANSGELIFNDVFRRTLGRVDIISVISIILNNCQDFVYGRGINLFNFIYEFLTVPIPRFIWPDKPIPITIQMAVDSFYEYFKNRGGSLDYAGGISAGFIGEAMWSNGLIGVSSVSLFLGSIFRFFDDSFSISKSSLEATPILFFSGYYSVISAESFSISMNSMCVALFAHILIFSISKFISD